MDFNENIYELIDRYLNGELKGQELADFEQQIESIPQLKDEIKIQQELLTHFEGGQLTVEESDPKLEEFLKSKELADLQGKLGDALNQHKKVATLKTEAKVRKLGWKPLAVAVSILLLVGFFYLMNQGGSSINTQELYAANVQHEPLALVTKGGEEELFPTLEQFYNNQDYEKAGNVIMSILDTLPFQSSYFFDLRLAQGISYLETDRHEEAQSIFDELQQGDYVNAPKRVGILVLTLLKMDDAIGAKKAIEVYLETGNRYKAEELKGILEEL